MRIGELSRAGGDRGSLRAGGIGVSSMVPFLAEHRGPAAACPLSQTPRSFGMLRADDGKEHAAWTDGIDLWGIKNCDTMKKRAPGSSEHGVAYRFRDYREEGADPARLDAWIAALGWEKVLNRSSTTFRALPDAGEAGSRRGARRALMLAEPTMIKRPVLERGDDLLLVGFKEDAYAAAFAGPTRRATPTHRPAPDSTRQPPSTRPARRPGKQAGPGEPGSSACDACLLAGPDPAFRARLESRRRRERLRAARSLATLPMPPSGLNLTGCQGGRPRATGYDGDEQAQICPARDWMSGAGGIPGVASRHARDGPDPRPFRRCLDHDLSEATSSSSRP